MNEEASKVKISRVYGRGFFDGLRKAGIENPEEYMNTARLAEMEKSINGVARSVLSAVPASEPWSFSQVHGELNRLKKKIERRTVDGCLFSLKQQGLVKEPEPGKFIRVISKPKLVAVAPPPSTTLREKFVEAIAAQKEELIKTDKEDLPPMNAAPKPEALDELASCAAQVREIAKVATALAAKIEEVAGSAEERTQRIYADNAKLRQLQELLKSMS